MPQCRRWPRRPDPRRERRVNAHGRDLLRTPLGLPEGTSGQTSFMTETAEQSLLKPESPTQAAGAERLATHPYRASLFVMLLGYALLTVILLGIGFLLTHALDGSVGRWDEHVNEYFA